MATHPSTKYMEIPFDSSDLDKPSPLALLATTVNKIGSSSPRRTRRQLMRTGMRTPSPPRREAAESSRARSSTPQHPLPLTPPPSPWPAKDTDAPLTSPSSESPHPAEVSSVAPSPLHRVAPLPAHYPVYHHLPVRYSPYSTRVPASQPVVPVMHHALPTCCHLRYPSHLLHQGMLPQLPNKTPAFGMYPHVQPFTSFPSTLKVLVRRRGVHVPVVERPNMRQVGVTIDVI